MALDATIGGASANSYITEAAADAYVAEGRLHTSAWDAATSATKERALIWATTLLDVSFDWFGHKRTIEQELRWPRSGVADLDGEYIDADTLPELLQEATVDLGILLIGSDRTKTPALTELGFSEAKVGDLEVVVATANVPDLIPNSLAVTLAQLGDRRAGTAGEDGVFGLDRS